VEKAKAGAHLTQPCWFRENEQCQKTDPCCARCPHAIETIKEILRASGSGKFQPRLNITNGNINSRIAGQTAEGRLIFFNISNQQGGKHKPGQLEVFF
jgi:hypothetical protein